MASAAAVLLVCCSAGQPKEVATPTPVLVATLTPHNGASGSPSASAATATRLEMIEYPIGRGQGPHDVAPAPDGGVWYTAQRTGQLGYLDPSNGEVRLVSLGALRLPHSAPHGVIVGPDGAPWVTDGGLNAIVRVDPKTSAVTRYPLSVNVDLNTATFDRSGTLWFTGQAGYYGYLRDDVLRLMPAPRGPGPYGIATCPDGQVYFASLAGSYVGVIDLSDATVRAIDPPTESQGARRVWCDSRSRVWVSEWNVGQLARFDGTAWKEWKLPGANPTAYAVFVDDQDVVWLTDFGANAIVRFDPKTETFTSLPFKDPNAAVRQLAGRPGEVWGAESGLDRLVVVRSR